MAEIRLIAPLSDEMVEQLKAGDRVLLNGVVYTGRDAAHKRMVEALDKGEKLPFDPRGQIIYYVGPTPTKPGKAIGSAGPTTSSRMDAYAPRLIEIGLKGMIGKGSRGKNVLEAMAKHKAVYFGAVGGAAAVIARKITSSTVIAFDDLGPEAVRRLEVKDFPVVVINDVHGNDLYQEGRTKYREP